jgi:hypothetical protein
VITGARVKLEYAKLFLQNMDQNRNNPAEVIRYFGAFASFARAVPAFLWRECKGQPEREKWYLDKATTNKYLNTEYGRLFHELRDASEHERIVVLKPCPSLHLPKRMVTGKGAGVSQSLKDGKLRLTIRWGEVDEETQQRNVEAAKAAESRLTYVIDNNPRLEVFQVCGAHLDELEEFVSDFEASFGKKT